MNLVSTSFRKGFDMPGIGLTPVTAIRQTRKILPALALACFCLGANAESDVTESPRLTLSGFGTAGVVRSSNPNAEFIRDVSQPKGAKSTWAASVDSLAGIQANVRLNDSIEAVIQGVSHYRYNGTYTPEITWAFFKYDISPRFSVRLGRIGTEFLMQSDSRMVGYSYLPVRPNVEFFGGVPINYGDGIDAQLRWPIGNGFLVGSLFAGYGRERLEPYKIDGSPITKASLGYTQGPWQVRYIFARATLKNNIESMSQLQSTLDFYGATQAASALVLAGSKEEYNSLGVTYDDGTWQAQAAIDSVAHQTVLFQNSRTWYVLVGHRIDNVSPYIGYAKVASTEKSLDTGLPNQFFGAINGAVAATLAGSHQDSHTTTLGVRWDVMRNVDIKAQLDFVRGTPSSVLLFQNVQPGWDGHTNVFSLALDYVF